jgi:hypothetical protein
MPTDAAIVPLSLPAYTALRLLDRSGRIYLLDHDLISKAGQRLGLIDLDDEARDYDQEYAEAERLVGPALTELESHDLVFRGADGGGAFPLTGIHPRGVKKPERQARVAAALALGPCRQSLPGARSRLSPLAAGVR